MSAGPSRPGHFWLFLAIGVACLLTLNLEFAPDWLAEGEEMKPAAPLVVPKPEPTTQASDDPKKYLMPAAARVPTIVARFGNESKEPVDDLGIKALATAMIEDHDVRIVLEGHSDTLGAEDFNHDLSLERANLVKAHLVELGVSPSRIETVGLGATHPLHSDIPDAASVNRRVEVRWVGRGVIDSGANSASLRRPALVPAPSVDAGVAPAVVVPAAPVSAQAAAPPVDAGRPATMTPEAGVASLAIDAGKAMTMDAGGAVKPDEEK